MSPNVHMQLRRAASLVHTVPGITLRIETDAGHLTVSHERGADHSPCEFRHALATASACTKEKVAATVTALELSHSIATCGELITNPRAATQEMWFSTLLHPQHVQQLLETSDCVENEEYCEARLILDCALSVTLVCISLPPTANPEGFLAAAETAFAICATEELIHGLEVVADTTGPVDR